VNTKRSPPLLKGGIDEVARGGVLSGHSGTIVGKD